MSQAVNCRHHHYHHSTMKIRASHTDRFIAVGVPLCDRIIKHVRCSNSGATRREKENSDAVINTQNAFSMFKRAFFNPSVSTEIDNMIVTVLCLLSFRSLSPANWFGDSLDFTHEDARQLVYTSRSRFDYVSMTKNVSGGIAIYKTASNFNI